MSFLKFAPKVAILCCSAILSVSALSARTVTDDNGDRVDVPEKIERVVVANILPLAAALTAYTGDGSIVAGMHPASYSATKNGLLGELFPEVLRADTSFIRGAALNVEALMALEPDLVLINAPDRRMLEQVRSAGLAAYAVSPTKWHYDVVETYRGWTASLEQLFPEVDGKGALIEARTREIESLVADRTKDIAEKDRVRVLFIVRLDEKEIVTSGRNFFGEYWCRAAGAANAAHDLEAENANARLSMESVYGYDPDVVILTNFTKAVPSDLREGKIPGQDWTPLKAVEENRIYKMPLGLYRTFTPGADTPLTLLWLAKTLYPARFEDVDLARETKRWYKEIVGVDLTDAQVERMYSPDRAAAEGASQGVRSTQ